MTPLEKALEKKMRNNKLCDKCIKIENIFYCKVSGKMLLPMSIENEKCVLKRNNTCKNIGE